MAAILLIGLTDFLFLIKEKVMLKKKQIACMIGIFRQQELLRNNRS